MVKHRVKRSIGFMLAMAAWLPSTLCLAASSPQFQLPVEVIASGGQMASSPQFSLASSVIGEPLGGISSSVQGALRGGAILAQGSTVPTQRTITVSGTVDDPAAIVTVNGTPVTLSGTTWSVTGITLSHGPNTITAVARDPAGNTSTQQIVIYFDPIPDPHTHEAPLLITVTGTVNDPSATVTLNLVHHTSVSVTRTATITGTTWQVTAFPLYDGLNTLTATARDPAGNTTTHRIQVFVDTAPPARPTVAEPPLVTTVSSHTFTGTKQAGTSVWINGAQVVPRNGETTWTATVALLEGDNLFTIVTHDAAGNSSTAVTLIIVVDNLPPVITVTSPPAGSKTNFTTATLTGTVDDHLTQVAIAGLAVTQTGRAFDAVVSLPEIRAYVLTITATSPHGYTSTQTVTITRGTIPTLTSATPRDGGKGYWAQPLTSTITATDAQSDPLEYQFLLDGVPLAAWSATNPQTWTSPQSAVGVHTLEFRVRDAFGGFASTSHEVLILRPPVNPP